MAGRGRGIIVDLVANANPFRRGTKQAEDALEDFGDSLDQVARDGDKAAEKLERSFKDTARAVNNVGDDVRRNSNLGSVGAEIGEEFSQNFGEAVRSGNPAEAITETFTSLGPAFGVAGLAVAAGAGIVNGVIQGIQQAKDRLKDAGNELYRALEDGFLDAAERKIQLTAALGVDEYEDALDKIARLASETGVSTREIAAYLQDGTDPSGRIAAAMERVEAAQRKAQAGSWENVDKATVSANEIADARERYLEAQRRGSQLLATDLQVQEGITAELRKQRDLVNSTPSPTSLAPNGGRTRA
jgi:ABC-type transporter Mla subunit MlaD